MIRFMMVTFAVLGWGFYELSGGSDFVSGTKNAAIGTAQAGTPAVWPAAASASTSVKPGQPALPDGVQLASFMGDMPASLPRRIVSSDLPGRATTLVRLGEGVSRAKSLPVKAVQAARDIELRVVDGNRVNLRNGPGTNYSVLGKLARGATVEVLQDNGDGWVKLRVAETGRVGWMADFLTISAN
jgi:uncharacterized protein YgiM (DUF1202 family)